MPRMMATVSSIAGHGSRAARVAVLGTVLPLAIATASDGEPHRAEFYIGAGIASLASIALTTVAPRHRFLFYLSGLVGTGGLTLMQAHTGGIASGYSVLMMMAMIPLGLEATDWEQLAGVIVLAACCFLPMVLIGAPAYPVSWGHATMLALIGCAILGSMRALRRETQELTERLRYEAVVDDLTGLLNRRGWRYIAPRELARSARGGNPIALMMLDLDKLKLLNDRLGHGEGDRVLHETAERIRATLRAGDVVARLGGDEFCALFTNSTPSGATTAIERLRESTPSDGSFSVGLAVWDQQEELSELVARADRALYVAKARGGGRTEVAAPTPLAPTVSTVAS
jgi:diguanylate cyclase (GGDEF)-like protein